MSPAEYATLSLDKISTGLEDRAREAESTFAPLEATQLNWRANTDSWSVAQCLAHLIVTNERTRSYAERALDASQPRTIWQRLPVLPGLVGPMLIKSQAPGAGRKIKTSPWARPTTSDFTADIVSRYDSHNRELAAWIRGLDAARAGHTTMQSPFARVLAYSVLDACRLVLSHTDRHLAQAKRVMDAPGFPRA